MVRVSNKRLIPVELLRRSTRRLRQQCSPACDNIDIATKLPTIKREQHDSTNDNIIASLDPPAKQVKLEPRQISGDNIKVHTKYVDTNYILSPDGYLSVEQDELDLERTLLGGQSFRWIKEEHPNTAEGQAVFTGTIYNHVLQVWRCDNKLIAYKKLNTEAAETQAKSDIDTLLQDYFQLRYKLRDLYEYWSKKDENFRQCSENYKGFRILRQDPVENLFSFICATNNNIKRISLMINGMCKRFGQELKPIASISMTPSLQDRFFTFPEIERLAQNDVFNVLRYELGFGYRAKFICETARKLNSSSFNSPHEYLVGLRLRPYKETCKQLQEFPGIGRKVADCICLMSMDHLNSVPIDCHIYEIVCRNYMKKLREERKTLTEKVHDMIGDYFVDLHGPLAGWATSVLFVGELKHLKKDSNEGDMKNVNNKTKQEKNGSKR